MQGRFFVSSGSSDHLTRRLCGGGAFWLWLVQGRFFVSSGSSGHLTGRLYDDGSLLVHASAGAAFCLFRHLWGLWLWLAGGNLSLPALDVSLVFSLGLSWVCGPLPLLLAAPSATGGYRGGEWYLA